MDSKTFYYKDHSMQKAHEDLLRSMDKETIQHLHEHFIKEATKKGLPGAAISPAPRRPALSTAPSNLDEDLSALSMPLKGSSRAKKSSLF